MAGANLTVDGRVIKLTHPDKVLFPGSGITKGALVDYYRRIASASLPHLRGRPLIMERYPEGISKGGFFQREVPEYFPTWIDRIALRKVGGKVTEAVAGDAATLVYMAEQNCITVHAGLSRREQLEYPDRMIIDLDPSATISAWCKSGPHPEDCARRASTESLFSPRDRVACISSLRLIAHRTSMRYMSSRVLAIVTAKRNSSELTVEQRKDKARPARVPGLHAQLLFADCGRSLFGTRTRWSARSHANHLVGSECERS